MESVLLFIICVYVVFTASTLHRYRGTLQAFSEDHLKNFYYNPLLEQLEGFVEHFIRVHKLCDSNNYSPTLK